MSVADAGASLASGARDRQKPSRWQGKRVTRSSGLTECFKMKLNPLPAFKIISPVGFE